MIHKFQNLNLQRWNKKVRKTCTVFKITDILLPANEFLVPNEAVGKLTPVLSLKPACADAGTGKSEAVP